MTLSQSELIRLLESLRSTDGIELIRAIAERSKNYRYSTNHQGVIDADTRLVVVVGRPLAGNRNDLVLHRWLF